MKLKSRRNVKQNILILGIMILVLLITKVTIAVDDVDYANGKNYNGDISEQAINGKFYTSNNTRSIISSKRIKDLKLGDRFWITGKSGKNQISRSPFVLCSEHGNNITTYQGNNLVKYKISKISRITTFDNHTPAEKGLAYLVSFARNGVTDFDQYSDILNDPVQNAFWTYSVENTDQISVLAEQTKEKGDLSKGNATELVDKTNKYRDYVANGAAIKDVKISIKEVKWSNDYSNLKITYSLNYISNDIFGNVTEAKICWKDNENKPKEMTIAKEKGEHTVTISQADIPDTGCNFTITLKHQYTTVDATIWEFTHVGNNKGRAQNLAIAIGERSTQEDTITAEGKIPTKVTNVSMQKYITKVTDGNGIEQAYSGRKNKYATNEQGFTNGYQHSKKISSKPPENNVSEGSESYKKDSYIDIEAGDTVEYTIEVYNNSNISANVKLYDQMINTAEIRRVLKDGRDITKTVKSQYPGKNTDNETGYRSDVLYEFNLGAQQKTVFTIEISYKTYNTNYSEQPVMNKAWIVTTPINQGDYRTIDADYIKMKEYKVSLEKWVSNVTKKNENNSNVVDNMIAIKYKNIIEYLKKQKIIEDQEIIDALNVLSEKSRKITLDQLTYVIKHNNIFTYNTDSYLTFDINKDKRVDDEDFNYLRAYEVYKTLGAEARDIIQKYINADLDKDEKVTVEDFNIYKALRANLYEDQEIDKNDRYIFILKLIFENGQYNENSLNNIKLKRLNETKDVVKDKIETYIKSDVNDDGVVNNNDCYILNETKTQITDINKNTYNILLSPEEIDKINIEDLNIDKYDLNNDRIINSEDIALADKDYSVFNNIDLDKLKTNFENEVTKKTDKLTEKYDFNGNGKIDIVDIKFTEDDIKNLLIFKDYNLCQKYDFNKDEQVDYNDYEFLEEYIRIKSKLEPETEEPITAEKIKEVIEKYNTYDEYDLNKLNQLAQILKNRGGSIEADAGNGYMDMDYISYHEFDINNDNIINDKDIQQIKSFDEKDIYVIKLYKGIKQYNSEIINLITEKYDFNHDNKINQEDLEIVNKIEEIQLGDAQLYINEQSNQEINEFIEIYETMLKQENNVLQDLNTDLNDSNINESKVGDINDYNLLQSFINQQEQYQKYISNKELYKDVTESNYNYYQPGGIIQYSQDEYYSYLDANEDERIDENDIKYLEDYNKNLQNINVTKENIKEIIQLDTNNDGFFDQSDIEIINKIKNITREGYKFNNDDKIDQEDLNLFKEAIRLTDSDKSNILAYLKNGGTTTKDNREGHAEYLTRKNNGLEDITEKDGEWTRHNTDKLDNVVTVEKGDIVTYTIKVTNDGDTDVYISEIEDTLPDGVTFLGLNNSNGSRYARASNTLTLTDLSEILLEPGKSATINVTVQVTESNMSIAILENIAEIKDIKNQYGIPVEDSTPYNNKDSDYIQLRDITIAGTVWNDKAFDKGANDYNGKFDNDGNKKETKLDGITVRLYRVGTGVVAETKTDGNGDYKFDKQSIIDYSLERLKKEPNPDEVFIKASKKHSENDYLKTENDYLKTERRWKSYYSYYIVFEYDGITYTSTPDGKTCVDITDETAYKNGEYQINQINSNAKEDNGPVKETRKSFNDRFSTINNLSEIEYTTKNENEYIPQSNHKYNPKTMAMQSSTNLIQMQNKTELEEQLKYVNLGLRGRDIFDLELISDVAKVDVIVNGQSVEYTDTNKVKIRSTDFPTTEDMKNKSNELIEENVQEYNQSIRDTDLNTSKEYTKTNEEEYGTDKGLQEIKVTYKITVTNASQTLGTATKVIDYYDKDYYSPTAKLYKQNENEEEYVKDIEIPNDAIKSGEKYNSVELNVGEDVKLSQSNSYYIYLTLSMDVNKLKDKFTGELNYPTYNMAEVYEYKTYATSAENEYTRGLLDKDSAPGSVEKEQVRTTNTEGQNTATINGNPTTVDYYFSKNNLNQLKYEDDTYATPTLYFINNNQGRKLSGTVFEDYTVLYGENERIKSGNGVQDTNNGEPGINGVTVELLENGVKRYSVTTGQNGEYTFENFLPGDYTIKYSYGDTEDTFIAKEPNTKSYNGEDFQATNNIGAYGAKTLQGFDNVTGEFRNDWYAFNDEGVSTAKDDSERRKTVSNTVTGFTDLQMQVLNNARDGKKDATVTGFIDENSKEVTITSKEIMDDTSMFATTPNFTLTVEKTVKSGNEAKQNDRFMDYEVKNMNFGIAEVPVTTIDLQKSIKTFTIRDSANQNTIAKITKDTTSYSVSLNPKKITANKKQVVIDGLANILSGVEKADVENYLKQDYDNVTVKNKIEEKEINNLKTWMNQYSISEGIKITHSWKIEAGDVTAPAGATQITAQIEDKKLQGAKLEITYEMIASMYTEKNFDNTRTTVPSIKGIIDYIDNDLSYNESLGQNSAFWEVTSYTEASKAYANAKYQCIRNGKTVTVIPKGTLDPEGKNYTTIVKAKEDNPLLLTGVGTSDPVEITLEKTLSSADVSIMDIITSSIDTYQYDNNIEITGLDYRNNTAPEGKIYRDRVRNLDRYIILAGSQHDSFSAETLSIIPPTGENRSINYYIIAITSLGILAIGVICIRKFVIKKDKQK